MKVFISHTFAEDDQELALKLQKILVDDGIEGYLAEKKKEYDLLIRDKIRKEIENSDHMVAIITNKAKESASVNQELGYALREGIKPVIMLEQNAKEGVLTHGIEPEIFSRDNFESSCLKVREHILRKGKRKKNKTANLDWLIENAYTPLYDKMIKIYENPDKFKSITSNPWKELEPSTKLKIEDDVKELLQKYSEELNNWKVTISNLNTNYITNQQQLGNIVKTAFDLVSLTKSDGYIQLDERSSQEPRHWLEAFKFIIFDDTITSPEILYDKLLNYAKLTENGHQQWLQKWKIERPILFTNIFNILPLLRVELRIDHTNKELTQQEQNLRELGERIVRLLEDKIR